MHQCTRTRRDQRRSRTRSRITRRSIRCFSSLFSCHGHHRFFLNDDGDTRRIRVLSIALRNCYKHRFISAFTRREACSRDIQMPRTSAKRERREEERKEKSEEREKDACTYRAEHSSNKNAECDGTDTMDRFIGERIICRREQDEISNRKMIGSDKQ